MNNIYLIGMPGCGKTTIGQKVSANLSLKFLDLDDFIANKTGKTIEEMFKHGEQEFRKTETQCLKEVAEKKNALVATGGGIVVTKDNIEIMKKTGTIIFIDSDVEAILSKCSLDGRPLLKNKDRIYNLYNDRINLYRKSASVTVKNNGTLADVCTEVEKLILKYL